MIRRCLKRKNKGKGEEKMIKLDVLSETMEHSIQNLEQSELTHFNQLDELEKEKREKFFFDYRMDFFQIATGSIVLKRQLIRPFSMFGKGYAIVMMLWWALFDSSIPFWIALVGSLFIFLFFQTLDQLSLNFQVETVLCWRAQNEKENLNQWKHETLHLMKRMVVTMGLFTFWVIAMSHFISSSSLRWVFQMIPTGVTWFFQLKFLKFWLKRENLYHFSSTFYFGLLNKEEQAMEWLSQLLNEAKH